MREDMFYNDGYMDEGFHSFSQFVDLDGKPVRKTPFSNPYNFDDYVEWKGNYRRGDAAVYSDRLWQWDTAKYKECYQDVFGSEGQKFSGRNPSGIEKFLSLYFGKNVTLTAILQGCNVSSGFPYWVFYYREAK